MIRRAFFWWLDYVYVGWWQLRHFLGGRDASRYLNGELAPVLLIPGVYETWQFLRPVANRLHALGHPVHVLSELRYNLLGVSESAALAQAYIEAKDLRGVIIVAHSKGGLIGKHMMVLDDTSGRIDRMTAIATPFGGSIYARYFLVRAIRAFRPNEPTLAMLGANAAANTRITSIFGVFDPHIPAGSRLEGATNVQLPVYGHFRLLADERVLEAVEKSIGD
ncbi:alpha/beta hydrolase [Glaciihabitans arcticus]|uniref:Alpha/beta hydrolase n=1 Tax=Glaciihabitans arcticus TaxID=2668039 RepID=A0A4Q9GXK7_9MICO|nr:alpha/beta hydrolase [Glaciihabitans arcticus]TBN57010.1 alpha/beta hydrolase [Glaciihabitans arcticus]